MAFQARFCFLFLTVWGRSYWNGIAKLIKSCVVPHEVQGCVKIMRCVLSRRILEKVRGTSCYSGDLSRWDLSFLGPKFNQQHMNKTWMSVRVYKGWFCSSTAGFVNKNAPTFSSSICVPYHPVRLFSFTVLLNISVFSAFFFFPYRKEQPFRFSSYLPTTTPLIFQLCILVPVAHPVFFQQPVFPCLVLLFLFLQYSL